MAITNSHQKYETKSVIAVIAINNTIIITGMAHIIKNTVRSHPHSFC